MQTDTYLELHLNDAKEYVFKMIGKKELYTSNDAYKLLKSFSYTEEIDFTDIPSYLPSAAKAPTDISSYTKGFINKYAVNNIYAINYGTGFVIIIISSENGYITNYYGDTINDFTLKIYYCLEVMIKHLFN